MKTKIIKGKKGEDLAVEFLKKQGFKVIERNWRFSRVGEVDIIARDGDALVFVEVKARTSINFGHPIEAISANKFNTMQKLAEIYISMLKQKRFSDFKKPELIEGSIISENRNTKSQLAYYKNQVDDYKDFRLDLVGILLTKEPEITHIKGIYE